MLGILKINILLLLLILLLLFLLLLPVSPDGIFILSNIDLTKDIHKLNHLQKPIDEQTQIFTAHESAKS